MAEAVSESAETRTLPHPTVEALDRVAGVVEPYIAFVKSFQ